MSRTDSIDLKVNGSPGLAKAPAEQPAKDKFGSATESGAFATPGAELRGGAGGGKRQPAKEKNPLVVVHVTAKREAIDNKSFDDMLHREGISVEPPASGKQLYELTRDRYAKDDKKQSNPNLLGEHAIENQDYDAVLVDASLPKIASCVARLNQDSANFTSVAVEPASPASDRAKTESDSAKKLVESLRQYNRGAEVQRQKDGASTYEKYYRYFDEATPEQESPRSLPKAAASSAPTAGPESSGQLSFGAQRQAAQEQARARRIQLSDSPKTETAAKKPAGGESTPGSRLNESKTLSPLAKKVKERAKSAADEVRVLFVFSPEESAAPSAAPAERTK
jgi:hypothetical protein